MITRFARRCLPSVVAILTAWPLAAQQEPAEPLATEPLATLEGGEVVVTGEETEDAHSGPGSDAVISEIIDVKVVNLEVVVTDKEGTPIEGLNREDFEVIEDGRLMELSNFYAAGEPVGPAAGDAAPEAPDADVSRGARGAEATAPFREATRDLHLVVFVDNLNIRPNSRKLVFESLREYLRSYRGQPIMLVTLGHRLELAQPFTRDLDRIQASLDEIERESAPHMLAEGQRKMLLSQLDRASLRRYNPPRGGQQAGEGDPEFEDAIRVARNLGEATRALAEERYQKVEATLEALGWLCDSLGGLAGRKALVYLSDGLPLRPADSLIEAWTDKYETWFVTSENDIRNNSRQPEAADGFQRLIGSLGSSQFDLQSELNRLTIRASDNRVALYPISASGRLSDFTSAEYQGRAETAGGLLGRRSSTVTENMTRDNALMRMAQDTGGVAVLRNANLARLLEQVERDFGSYYSLGYAPLPGRDDFRFHRIEVRVLRPGVRVRHIKGYRHKNWRQRLGEMTTAAALFAVESNPLGVSLASGEPTREGDGYRVPVMVKIPFEQMRLVHKDEHFNANLTVLVVVRNEKDELSGTRRFDLPIRIPDSRVLEVLPQIAAYPFELTVPGGSKRVAVGVRDHLAQTEATVKVDLVVAETSGPG